jgi:Tfp pilus assembly protein PilX
MKSMSGIRKSEQGMASILVTMIMIIVITLIVLGFSEVTRRNQSEALDSQLSTQAYYAAESGVNAAVNYLTNPSNPTYTAPANSQCNQFIDGPLGGGSSNPVNVLDNSTQTQYTCLLVNTEPSSLVVAPLAQTSGTVLHVANSDGLPITTLNFQWGQQTGSNFSGDTCNAVTSYALPSYGSWDCPYGILRVDLVSASSLSAANANAALENNESVTTLYLIPSYQSGAPYYTQTASMSGTPAWQPVDPSAASNTACDGNPSDPAASQNCPVRMIHVTCTTSGCALKLNISGGQSEYYARVSMMYQDASVLTITGADSVTGLGDLKFSEGQALIDSTGQSEDELRRIQVRIPLVASTSPSLYSLQSTDTVCKELSDGPNVATTDNCP